MYRVPDRRAIFRKNQADFNQSIPLPGSAANSPENPRNWAGSRELAYAFQMGSLPASHAFAAAAAAAACAAIAETSWPDWPFIEAIDATPVPNPLVSLY